MSAIATIEKVLATLAQGPLQKAMVYVPQRGASDAEFLAQRPGVPRDFSRPHRQLLAKWNGINLDMLRIYGIGAVDSRIRPMSRGQIGIQADHPDWLIFASDPAGFAYAEDGEGRIHMIDTQSMASEPDSVDLVASDLDDFIERYVFGADSDQFGGDEWKVSLHRLGVW